MTAPSSVLESAAPLMRWRAVASILRRDMQLLGPYALACATGLLATSALLGSDVEFIDLLAGMAVGNSRVDRTLQIALLGLCQIVVPTLFLILLAQTNGASDTRHDWLIRPVNPLELVAAKSLALAGVIIGPIIAGSLLYMLVNGVPLQDASMSLWILSWCIPALILSWLVSTAFRALLALLAAFGLGMVAMGLAWATRAALSAAGNPFDPTSFAVLEHSWITSVAYVVVECGVAGLTLWLLLARRRRNMARWLYLGYMTLWAYLQGLLFISA